MLQKVLEEEQPYQMVCLLHCKTGTTNKSLDAWFVGYTPYYVGATYIGDDAGRKDTNGNTISRKKYFWW